MLTGQAAHAEGLGQATAAPSVNGGWGRGSQGGSQGEPAAGSNLDGWDDMDPMALLSGSVQSQAKAQDIYSAKLAQPIMPRICTTQATQQRLPDAQLDAAPKSHDHKTEPASSATSVQSHRAPSVKVDRPDPSKPSSEGDSSDFHHQLGADIKQHVDGHEQKDTSTSSSMAASSQKNGAAPQDANHSSRFPSLETNSNQQGTTATALREGNAQQEVADDAASGACPSTLEGIVPMEAAMLTAESSLADVQSMLGQGDRAVIHTRAPGRDAFGPTLVYGYPGVVFEATQAGCIAAVTIF